MESGLTLLVARFVALVYIPLGVAMLTGQTKGKEMIASYQKSSGLSLFIGIFAVMIGILLVLFHNYWVRGWPVLVTLLGWVAVIEGVLFIAFPKSLLKFTMKMSKNEKIWGIFAMIVGLVFGYFGFLA